MFSQLELGLEYFRLVSGRGCKTSFENIRKVHIVENTAQVAQCYRAPPAPPHTPLYVQSVLLELGTHLPKNLYTVKSV